MSPTRLTPASTPVFVLAGGLGTRLRDVEPRPKAIIPVAGRPFVAYLLRCLCAQGFQRVHLLLGVGADAVRDSIPELARISGLERDAFTFSIEKEPLGTGGAVSAARAHAGALTLLANADSFADIDYAAMLAFHQSHADPDCASLLALWQDDRADYGGLLLDGDRVGAFREKGERTPGWINGGVYLLPRAIIDSLPEGPSSLERDCLPLLAGQDALLAYRAQGHFRDIGTPERLRAAEQEFRALALRLGIPD